MELSTRFTAGATRHRMTILLDQGLNRVLRFRNPSDGEDWFELITAPRSLTFRGDDDAFVFARYPETDMFRFFRSAVHRDGSLRIDPGYWATKLDIDRASVRAYSPEAFERYVAETLAEAEEEFPGVSEAWASHAEGYYTEAESAAIAALDDFEFGARAQTRCHPCSALVVHDDARLLREWLGKHVGPGHELVTEDVDGFTFPDVSDLDFNDFTGWFLFACSAIVWGIAEYDAYERNHRGGRARHKVTFNGAHRHVEHPEACNWLPYGEHCDLDQAFALHEFDTPPVAAGTVWARAVGTHGHRPEQACPDGGCELVVTYEGLVEQMPAPESTPLEGPVGLVPGLVPGPRLQYAAWTSPPVAGWAAAAGPSKGAR